MKKIVVTGATGFVGYHVARKLVEKKLGEVFCFVRPGSNRKFISALEVRFVEGDLRDKKSLEAALDGASLLYHVAADYRLWSKEPKELFESNVGGTEKILAVAKERGIKKVIYTSSVSAVGRPHKDGLLRDDYETMKPDVRAGWEKECSGNETMDPTDHHLIGPYKKSKYYAELVARNFALKGLPVVIVNPSTPVGSHDVKPTQTGKLILDFLNGKMPAYLDTGLNLVDVEDVAEGHLLAAEKGKVGERYILGNRNLMLKEILMILAKISGRPAPRIKIPYWIAYTAGFFSTVLADITGNPPGVPLDGVRMAKELMFYDAKRAVDELGMPQGNVETALEKAVRFFRENGYVKNFSFGG